MNAIIIAFVVIIIISYYNRNYYKGLCASLFFLFLLPEILVLKFPGSIPDLTVHRVIIIVMTIYFYSKKHIIRKTEYRLPFKRYFLLILISITISTAFSVVILKSFKALLNLLLEQILFFYIVYNSIINLEEDDCTKYIKSLLTVLFVSMFIVCLHGFFERWADFNIQQMLPRSNPEGYVIGNIKLNKMVGRVKSTFPHAILLGYAITMVWPFILYQYSQIKNNTKKWHLLNFFMHGSVLFFTSSRGPWIGSFLAAMIVFLLGSGKIKKYVIIIPVILFLIFTIRPQVAQSVFILMNSIADTKSSTLKGRSFNYRFELIWKAHDEISKSLTRLLFGYGDNSRHNLNLMDYERKSGRMSFFWSWDNEYAAVMLERGYFGLIVFVMLYWKITLSAFKLTIKAKNDRDFYLLLFTGIIIYSFMMTNVKVFSTQVTCILWLYVAIVQNYYVKQRIL